MTTYTVIVNNPIIGKEVMRIETDDYTLAALEAAHLSIRHGVARIYDNSSNREVARYRYGVEEKITGHARDQKRSGQ
jgi:hypothetical protein